MKLIKTKLGMFLTEKIMVNDVEINCLVDTGSAVTIICETVTKPKGTMKAVNLFGINGESKTAFRTKLAIEFDEVASIGDGTIYLRSHPVLLINLDRIKDNYSKKHNIRGIIGMDIISKTNWLNLCI